MYSRGKYTITPKTKLQYKVTRSEIKSSLQGKETARRSKETLAVVIGTKTKIKPCPFFSISATSPFECGDQGYVFAFPAKTFQSVMSC